eukprot:413693_1
MALIITSASSIEKSTEEIHDGMFCLSLQWKYSIFVICSEEAIVSNNGDQRHPITESPYKKEDIIKCIGQLKINFNYPQQKYRIQISGTGTVFATNDKICFVLTVAHNIIRRIKECSKCLKYMECKIKHQEVIQCIHDQCAHTTLNYKMIKYSKIQFHRREIKLRTREENESEFFIFGDPKECYICKCEYFDEKHYNKYPTSTVTAG